VAQGFGIAGIAALAVTAIVILPLIRRGWRHLDDPDSTTEPWALWFISVATAFVLTLFGATVAVGGALLPLVGGLSVQLLLGLWLFARLLTRPN
jgi:hypothetical protein